MSDTLSKLIHKRLQQIGVSRYKTRSLILATLSEAVAPYGSKFLMGDLLPMLAELNINAGQARTAITRLHKEGWVRKIDSAPRGHYRLQSDTLAEFDRVTAYLNPGHSIPWEGVWWHVVLNSPRLTDSERKQGRKQLRFLGFGHLEPWVMIHPRSNLEAIKRRLDKAGILEKIIVFRSRIELGDSTEQMRELVENCWNLNQVVNGYKEFIETYEPILNALEDTIRPSPRECFIIRIICSDDIRYTSIEDPDIPAELMPNNEIKQRARDIHRRITWATQYGLETYLKSG